jgi:hypothetical protein
MSLGLIQIARSGWVLLRLCDWLSVCAAATSKKMDIRASDLNPSNPDWFRSVNLGFGLSTELVGFELLSPDLLMMMK